MQHPPSIAIFNPPDKSNGQTPPSQPERSEMHESHKPHRPLMPKVSRRCMIGRYSNYHGRHSIYAFCTENGTPFFIGLTKNLQTVLSGPKSPAMKKFQEEEGSWLACLYTEKITGDPNQREGMTARMYQFRDIYANPVLMMRRGKNGQMNYHSYKGAGTLAPAVKKALHELIVRQRDNLEEFDPYSTIHSNNKSPVDTRPVADGVPVVPPLEKKEPEAAAKTDPKDMQLEEALRVVSQYEKETAPEKVDRTSLVVEDPKHVRSQIDFARKSGWDVESVNVECKVVTTIYLMKKSAE